MPDPKNKHPRVEGYLKKKPEDEDFFSSFPVPSSRMTSDSRAEYEQYISDLTKHDKELKDKAELYYYSDILNKDLQAKNPKLYEEVSTKYGFNGFEKSDAAKTRVTGAENYAQKNPNFYLTPEEQKAKLGDSWNRYNELRKNYGKDLNLFGESELNTNPETWKYGARHSVAFNPAGYTEVITHDPKKTDERDISTFGRQVKYTPEGTTSYSTYGNVNPDDPSKNVVNVYNRTLVKVSSEIKPDRIKDEQGRVIFQEPGVAYYKYYDDGTKQEIPANLAPIAKKFNSLPQDIKNLYAEEVGPDIKNTVASK